jgi:hypothetical protein
MNRDDVDAGDILLAGCGKTKSLATKSQRHQAFDLATADF